MNLKDEIASVLEKCPTTEVQAEYEARLEEGSLVRAENQTSHFCVYFVPFNPKTKQVLVGDHKKSGKWLMPGGHVEAGDSILKTLNKEIEEELGVSDFYQEKPEAFLCSITNIDHDVRPCKKHFDIWHKMETDGPDITVDYTEYHEVRWLTILEARELIDDPANLLALDALEK